MNDRRRKFIEENVGSADRRKVRRFSKNFDKLTEQELEQLIDVTSSDGIDMDTLFEHICQCGWFNEGAVSMWRRLYK